MYYYEFSTNKNYLTYSICQKNKFRPFMNYWRYVDNEITVEEILGYVPNKRLSIFNKKHYALNK